MMLEKAINYNLNRLFKENKANYSVIPTFITIVVLEIALGFNIENREMIFLILIFAISSVLEITRILEKTLSSDEAAIYMTLPIQPKEEVIAKVYSSSVFIFSRALMGGILIFFANRSSALWLGGIGRIEAASLIVDGYGTGSIIGLYALIAIKSLIIISMLSAAVLLVVLVKNIMGNIKRNIIITGIIAIISMAAFVLVVLFIKKIGTWFIEAGVNYLAEISMEIFLYVGVLVFIMKVSQWILSKKYNL